MSNEANRPKGLRDCLSRFRPSRQVDVDGDESFPQLSYEDLNEDAVDWVVEAAAKGLDTEASRNELLDTKGLQLVGFSGVVLAILVNAGSQVTGGNLGCALQVVFMITFLVSLAGLISSAWLAVVGVLAPRAFRRLGPDASAEYLQDPDLMKAERAAIQVRALKGMVRSARQQHAIAEDKARSLQCAYNAFLVGVASAALVAVILGSEVL